MANPASKLWTCTNCGRKFAKKNQWHSCQARGVDDHFRGKPPQLKETFELLLTRMREFGPLRVDAVKSSINFATDEHCSWSPYYRCCCTRCWGSGQHK